EVGGGGGGGGGAGAGTADASGAAWCENRCPTPRPKGRGPWRGATSWCPTPVWALTREGGSSAGGLEYGPEAVEVGAAEDETVASRDVDEVEVDTRAGHLSRQVGEHAGPILDLDDDDLALARHGQVRDREGVPGRLCVRDEDVQLDPFGGAHAGRCGQVHPCVADRRRDAREGSGLVVDLDDQVERD